MSTRTNRYRSVLCLATLLTLIAPAISAQSTAGYLIGPQDVLTIQVYDQPTLTNRYTVDADGQVNFPLIGRIKAAGMSLRDFQDALTKQLANGYLRNPQVSVVIEQYRSQQILVLGEVKTSGPVPLTGGMTLIEALARAGSTLPSASGEVVVVRPQGGKGKTDASGRPTDGGNEILRANIRDLESGQFKQNIDLQDGDTIFVPRAESVYVFGQVRTPGAYPIQKNTTVLQALSLAGGVTEFAATNRITIVRMVKGDSRKIKVKFQDLVLAGDTIMVPERRF